MTPPLLESYKYSTGQVESHKSTQFYLYQISHLHFKKNFSIFSAFLLLPHKPSSLCPRRQVPILKNPHPFAMIVPPIRMKRVV